LFKLLPVVFTFFILSIVPAFSEKPPEGEGWNYITKGKNTAKGSSLSLLPAFSMREKVLQSVKENNPEMSIEMYYKMPLPKTGNGDLFLFLFNRLNRFSSMKGIKYYSANKDRMTTYLEKCYLVSKKGGKDPVTDPVFTRLPDKIEFKIYQKDTTFGSNWYSVRTIVSEDAIWLRMVNITRMRYFFIPIMKPGDIIIDIIIIPRGDGLELYTLSQLKKAVSVVFGKKIYLPGVFDHRVSAIQGWFARQIYSNPVPGMLH